MIQIRIFLERNPESINLQLLVGNKNYPLIIYLQTNCKQFIKMRCFITLIENLLQKQRRYQLPRTDNALLPEQIRRQPRRTFQLNIVDFLPFVVGSDLLRLVDSKGIERYFFIFLAE